jgi:hypothetical protein
MPVQARRFALLIIAFGVIAISLVACQTPTSANQGGSNAILIPTPNSSNLTPTPKFPGFTVGTWPSNFAPNLNDTITIYVVCRIQDQSMQGPSHPPPAGVQVNVSVGSPINQQFTAHTGADGYATVTFSFNDPNPGQPVRVDVTTSYPGSPPAETFFTPGVQTQPTPTSGPGNGNGNGNGTPTVGP